MENAKLSAPHANDAVLGEYIVASDDFPFDDSEETISDDVESNGDVSVSDFPDNEQMKEDEAGKSPGLRRRRSFKHRKSLNVDPSGLSGTGPEIDSVQLPIQDFNKTEGFDQKKLGDGGSESLGFVGIKDSSETGKERVDIDTNDDQVSTITDANADVAMNDGNEVSSKSHGDLHLREDDEAHSSLLLMFAGASLRAILFQITLLCKFLTFPLWSAYTFYAFVCDPFGFSKRAKAHLSKHIKTIWDIAVKNIFPFIYEQLKERKGWWSLALKCGRAFLWLCYVCMVIFALMLSAFAIGGLLIRVVMEEPVRMNSRLDFDFKEKNPSSSVPLMVIPPHREFEVTVSLTLPESYYNQNLGIFQVRVDLLTAEGKTHTSSKRPCMLQFRSKPIRLLLTFLKAAPILAGYVSETQDLKVKFHGFTEGKNPSGFLRVAIEQRAEFFPSGGIPEIYSASVALESKLPFLKRFIWSWRRIILVWISFSIFTVELAFVLICCRPFLAIPRIRRS